MKGRSSSVEPTETGTSRHKMGSTEVLLKTISDTDTGNKQLTT